MLRREEIIVEMWRRVLGVNGVTSKRNPETPPRPEDLPAVNLFEWEEAHDQSWGRDYPTFHNVFPVAVEVIIKGTSEAAANSELAAQVDAVLEALYAKPKFLGKKGELIFIRTTRPVSLAGGEHIKGIGLVFNVRYGEDFSELFS
jgi:hypothetical protein